MNKKDLIDNLKNDIYCRIGISKISGVGVIAIRNIPKGINPFKMTKGKCLKYRSINVTKKDIINLSPDVQKLVTDFISPNDDLTYSIPSNGLNSLDISFYMNHSKNNNIDVLETKCDYLEFVTNIKIKKGDELTINYNDYK